MKITLFRTIYSNRSTIGDLYLNDKFFCNTLEDVCRDLNRDGDLKDPGEAKVYGKTAIPGGRYPVVLSFSNRFRKVMPEVIGVAGFSGIRIHNGNTADHTDGCILVGLYDPAMPDFVGQSKLTFSRLMSRLEIAAKLEKITIEIIDQPAVREAA